MEEIPNRVYDFEWSTGRGYGGFEGDPAAWAVFLLIRREGETETFVFTPDQAEQLIAGLRSQIAIIDSAQPGSGPTG